MKNLLVLGALTLALAGCAAVPTKFDRIFADVQTNYVPVLVIHTNVLTVLQTNVATVTVTNQVGVAVPIFQTNVVTAFQTNLVPVMVTNEQYTLTAKPIVAEVAGVAGTVGNIAAPGSGALITGAIGALATIFLGYRNRQFKGQNNALSQSAGVLTQIIETGREVMATTPQGRDAADEFTTWMKEHQKSTQTAATIADLVKDNVSNQDAQRAAAQILALLNTNPPRANV